MKSWQIKNLLFLVPVLLLVAFSYTYIYANSTYSTELQGAYTYAYQIGSTSQTSIDTADMYWPLIRSHMAKMMVNYAIKVIGLQANVSRVCDFTDIDNESPELKGYIKQACQLGIMGQNISDFKPNAPVTRAEFGTTLSRTLYGTAHNGSIPFYVDHLEALKHVGIMMKIDLPEQLEIRGYVMLMLQRASTLLMAKNGYGYGVSDDWNISITTGNIIISGSTSTSTSSGYGYGMVL